MATRSGIGYDVHRLVAGRKLILGGVDIPHEKGLEGHSDADVLCHAIADALLGALGEEDIGHYFPPSDPSIKDISSIEILKKVGRVVADREAMVINVDATLIAEAPRILPHVPVMKENIAHVLGMSIDQVGVKATTNEGMGFVGRGEGMAAMAVANVEI
ncbi:MAG: 2-C-methyl-D-erythritol 2,4-cyclodiphosphate synthase [Verrucomicrobiales bacterium]